MPYRHFPPLPTFDDLTKEHLTSAVVAAMGDGISIIDRDFRVLYQNPAHQHLAGGGSHVGEICYRAYSQRDTVCPACPIEAAFTDRKVHRLVKTLPPGQNVTHIEIMASPLFNDDGEVIAGIEMVRDISALMQAREATEALNRDLTRQACELEAANQELEAFSYSLSHDMRTPMAQVQLACDGLRELLSAALAADTAFLFDTLENSVQRLNRLIEAMLNLAHASTFTLNHELIDLSATAEDILVELRLQAPTRKIELDIARGLEAYGDPVLLRTALQNLLENAWKYTGKTTRPRIEFGRAEIAGEQAFFVRDNGVGFASKDSDKLFHPFSRLASAGEFRGTGLGLATVQRIIQRHGGRIWAEAELGQGATFFFTLPQ